MSSLSRFNPHHVRQHCPLLKKPYRIVTQPSTATYNNYYEIAWDLASGDLSEEVEKSMPPSLFHRYPAFQTFFKCDSEFCRYMSMSEPLEKLEGLQFRGVHIFPKLREEASETMTYDQVLNSLNKMLRHAQGIQMALTGLNSDEWVPGAWTAFNVALKEQAEELLKVSKEIVPKMVASLEKEALLKVTWETESKKRSASPLDRGESATEMLVQIVRTFVDCFDFVEDCKNLSSPFSLNHFHGMSDTWEELLERVQKKFE